jgi:hypothetical protein
MSGSQTSGQVITGAQKVTTEYMVRLDSFLLLLFLFKMRFD